MKIKPTKHVAFTLLFAGAVALGSGCEPKGPAEKAGESVDRGIENVKDAVDPAGPVEKAGRSVDKVLDQ